METPAACADAPRRAQFAVMATHFEISTVAHRKDWRLPAGFLPGKPPSVARARFSLATVKRIILFLGSAAAASFTYQQIPLGTWNAVMMHGKRGLRWHILSV